MVYHHHIKSYDSVLLGVKINKKYFQYFHLLAVQHNIETTNVVRNQNHLSRLYLLHSSTHVVFEAIMFSLFQLDIVHPVWYL